MRLIHGTKNKEFHFMLTILLRYSLSGILWWWAFLIFFFTSPADNSVIALATRCVHLRSLGLYYCQNITDRAMYSLAQSRVKNKPAMWESMKGRNDEDGLRTLNISQCTALTPPAVQALCDTFPSLHTCSGRHSLMMSGCLNLTSVHCACAIQAHRTLSTLPHSAHWTEDRVADLQILIPM